MVHWEVGADFQKVPAGDFVDIVYEHLSPGTFVRSGAGSSTLAFDVEAETAELTRWLLLPQGKEYRTFQLIRYRTGKPSHRTREVSYGVLGGRFFDSRFQTIVARRRLYV